MRLAGEKDKADPAKGVLRQARFVASDAVGVRIEGVNAYPWVFPCKDTLVYQPEFSRGGRVAVDRMSEHQPEVWFSDRYNSQQNYGRRQQTCLAHLARENAFALKHGSDELPLRFKFWFGKVFTLAAQITHISLLTKSASPDSVGRQV